MDDITRASLIVRVKNRDDSQAWQEFDALYGPLIYRYARARNLSRDDAEDVRSQCMAVVVQQIAGFEYDKAKGGFKNWLRRIAYNKIVDLCRKRHEKLAESQDFRELADSDPTPDEVWDNHWMSAHLRYCVEQVRPEVSEQNYRAFCMLTLEEKTVEDVCAELGINANQAYKAKSRFLERIREKMAELGAESD